MFNARLTQQMQFLTEADKIKSIFRRNRILHGDRLENDAEHSWQLALMAIVLSEHADPKVDVLHVVKMLLVHDLVEIDAGDTFAFDPDAVKTQHGREVKAAERVFGLLPEDMAGEMRALWEEFDSLETPEAKFAASLDHFGGGSCRTVTMKAAAGAKRASAPNGSNYEIGLLHPARRFSGTMRKV